MISHKIGSVYCLQAGLLWFSWTRLQCLSRNFKHTWEWDSAHQKLISDNKPSTRGPAWRECKEPPLLEPPWALAAQHHPLSTPTAWSGNQRWVPLAAEVLQIPFFLIKQMIYQKVHSKIPSLWQLQWYTSTGPHICIFWLQRCYNCHCQEKSNMHL